MVLYVHWIKCYGEISRMVYTLPLVTVKMTERDLHTCSGRYITQDWNPRSAFRSDRYVNTVAVASQSNLTCDTASLGSAPVQRCLHVF
jgi:hypothetical protein